MAINPLYIPLFNIEEVILDKDTGLPLAAGVVKFYRDSQRLTPKVVYQIAGVSPNYSFVSLGAELTLGLSGTFVDQDGDPIVPYAYPYDSEGELDLYYVTVESEGGVSQFVRQAVPYVDAGGISPSERTSTENEIANPQFVEVLFPTSGATIINVTGTNTVTPVAPGWDIVSTGTGTLTLERLEPISASTVTNPPYALRIEASTGLGSTVTLRQRFYNTPSIFRDGFASGSLAAAVISGGGSFISMNYIPSTGTATEVIASTSIPTDGAYHIIEGNAAIPDQANTAASTGYVDISITLPTGRNLAFTSIQIVGTTFSVDIPFDEQTAARQKDHLFHYYEDGLIYKPIPSHLVGWDFPLNPAQFAGHTLAAHAGGANTSYYAWDQTILFQSANSAFTVGQSVDGALNISPVITTQVGVIQYLSGAKAREILNQPIAVNVCAYCDTGFTVDMTISLWYTTDASLPSVASNNSLVATLDANGKPATFHGNWTEVTRTTSREALMTLKPQTNPMTSQNFGYWDLANSTIANTATFFAIVVGTKSIPIATTSLYFRSISLCSGTIATLPAAQSADQVLRECEYYYAKTFPEGVVPAQNAGLPGIQGYFAYIDGISTGGIIWNYPVPMHAIPAITTYSPSAASANWYNPDVAAPSGTAFPSDISTKNVVIRNPGVAGDFKGDLLCIHVTADARLGA